ncbi:amidinotransferase [Candidatus Kaiserbacteria bacterium CG10_big_fil_rev_8_21_14_0_10_51_14]|uniref:Amidinotransferase n=1 Tax=Candidatus Kaiserbacteria bacterium CG10_big_fil_rev_8_21_14_0_10_51_14 TaxID=1974610 RepID=A0A2H0UBL6_9BACT|nr:MAG: amidinotransferase [Candidatus Kaiserbacteria bacterium CG10_big_fil_rev_8_21_14_0_10_51_14]
MPQNKGDRNLPVVQSYNEWDPLEEVVVGVVEGATVPPWDAITMATVPSHAHWFFKKYGGKPFPSKMIQKASEELEGLATLFKELGIMVRRPEQTDFSKQYQTPWWKSRGLYAAMPRDVLITIGDTLIEAPMAWRTRYFEIHAYRPLIRDYFERGAKWLSAPKPSMDDNFYDNKYQSELPYVDGKKQFIITNEEVAFDAADFVRFGRDILVQKSQVTNDLGIEWVRRHIGPEYTIHEVEFDDPHPMHIDTTIVPLAPGKIMVNPTWVKKLPKMFKSWDVLEAPQPAKPFDSGMYFSSDWLSINILSIDEKRVMVEAQEEPLIRALHQWGFEPIPVPFRNFYPFGGSVHCATLDVRRRGTLQSYF